MSYTPSTRSCGNKLSKAERGHIQEIIVTLLLKQAKPSEIYKACSIFKLSDRMIRKYVENCKEMIATRPLETVDRAKRILYSELEALQAQAEHTRDKIDIIKYKAKLLGLDDNTVNIHHHKHNDIPEEKLIEVILEDEDKESISP